jgi:sugar lactone lactonase YvrE
MSAPTITCPSGHSNPAARNYCGECGLSLLGVCPNGHQNPEGRRYCGECGIPLQRLDGGAGPGPATTDTASNRADIEQDGGSVAVDGTTHWQGTTGPTPARPPRRRNTILAAVGVTVAIVIGLLTVALTNQGWPVALPFSGLDEPSGVAVDNSGAVYVTDPLNHRVLKLEAGASTQTVLPFTDLQRPRGVAVDSRGAVYVADTDRNQVLKLEAGSSTQTVLPFTDLFGPRGVAVGSGGAVYVADTNHRRVLRLEAGASTQTPVLFTDLVEPVGLAVDSGGAVYVTDIGGSNERVLKLEAGASTQTVLPFTDLFDPVGVAVDRSGAVYVVNQEHRPRVLKLAADSGDERATLPVYWPNGVAVDSDGAVYVTGAVRRVLKVPARCIADAVARGRDSPGTGWLCKHVNVLRSALLAVRG